MGLIGSADIAAAALTAAVTAFLEHIITEACTEVYGQENFHTHCVRLSTSLKKGKHKVKQDQSNLCEF